MNGDFLTVVSCANCRDSSAPNVRSRFSRINRTSSFAQGLHSSTRSLGKAFLKRWFHLPFNLQAVSFNLLFFRPVLAYQGSTKDNGGTFTASNQAIANTRSHIYCTVFAVSLMASSQILQNQWMIHSSGMVVKMRLCFPGFPWILVQAPSKIHQRESSPMPTDYAHQRFWHPSHYVQVFNFSIVRPEQGEDWKVKSWRCKANLHIRWL